MGAKRHGGVPHWRLQYALIPQKFTLRTWTHDALDGWNRGSHPMTKDDFGVFEIVLPAVDGQLAIPHKSKLKVSQAEP